MSEIQILSYKHRKAYKEVESDLDKLNSLILEKDDHNNIKLNEKLNKKIKETLNKIIENKAFLSVDFSCEKEMLNNM